MESVAGATDLRTNINFTHPTSSLLVLEPCFAIDNTRDSDVNL